MGKTPIPAENINEWQGWMFNHNNKVVKQDIIDGVFISTVFIGINQNLYADSYEPLLFETALFGAGKDNDGVQMRYRTWKEAELGHKKLYNHYKKQQNEKKYGLK